MRVEDIVLQDVHQLSQVFPFMEFLRDFHLSKDNIRNDLETTTLRVLISLSLVYSRKVLVTLNYFQLYTKLGRHYSFPFVASPDLA